MEMGSIQNESAAPAATGPPATPEEDIMQFARTGDVPAMEKLFESGDFDATYTDDEGITPLHVCETSCLHREKLTGPVGSNKQPVCNVQVPH